MACSSGASRLSKVLHLSESQATLGKASERLMQLPCGCEQMLMAIAAFYKISQYAAIARFANLPGAAFFSVCSCHGCRKLLSFCHLALSHRDMVLVQWLLGFVIGQLTGASSIAISI